MGRIDEINMRVLGTVCALVLQIACGGSGVDANGDRVDAAMTIEQDELDENGDRDESGVGEAEDAGLSPEVSLDDHGLPTWASCRRAYRAGALDEVTKALCDQHFLEAPGQRLYGIRFVMIQHPPDAQSWLNERVSYMQAVFASEGIQFATRAVEDFSDTVVPGATGENTVRLGDAAQDVAKFLGVSFVDEEQVIGALVDALRVGGVAESRLATLGVDLELPDAGFWRLLARADSEHITLVVTDTITPGGGFGSKASPPPVDATSPLAGIVFLFGSSDAVGPDNPMVMAHEMGHYFGLAHTFEQPSDGVDEERCRFDSESRGLQFSRDFGAMDPQEALLAYWDLEGSPFEAYVPYDTSEHTLEAFEAYRKALTLFGTQHHFSYRAQGERLTSNAEYWQRMNRGQAVYVKNFIAGNLNNCDWSDDHQEIGCTVEGAYVSGTDPLVDGTVVFQNGTVGNLMSYISPSHATSEVPHDTLHHDQFVVTRITSHSASHQALRNYALK